MESDEDPLHHHRLGAILIGVAALFFVGTFVDLSGFSGGVVTAVASASLGGLLVVGGSVAAVLRARNKNSES